MTSLPLQFSSGPQLGPFKQNTIGSCTLPSSTFRLLYSVQYSTVQYRTVPYSTSPPLYSFLFGRSRSQPYYFLLPSFLPSFDFPFPHSTSPFPFPSTSHFHFHFPLQCCEKDIRACPSSLPTPPPLDCTLLYRTVPYRTVPISSHAPELLAPKRPSASLVRTLIARLEFSPGPSTESSPVQLQLQLQLACIDFLLVHHTSLLLYLLLSPTAKAPTSISPGDIPLRP
ncbi:uncharacterized protein LY89DRAFT_86781 [Mollisia scopiformis]|uniref:Uncharacterized protein n=1 Tax=Mollisia scopiformis TaxID=149040 RepID=A0A194X8P7_MOLSC|nr:uncharacterized protein LY89DRAFT_86781 [Mollisia scopiformis]KUJ16546.1 hypothetical protein LY89DRAFT_86781 [Mollisia scopiformis]